MVLPIAGMYISASRFPDDEGWRTNATRLFGISLHPLGELSAVEFIEQAQGDLEEQRARYINLAIQCMCSVLCAYIFIYNAIISAKRAYRRFTLLYICTLIQALAGIAFTITLMLFHLSTSVSCREVHWVLGLGLALFNVCTCAILLQKAYIVCNYNRKLLILGIILAIPQPQTVFYFWASPSLMLTDYGCVLNYPTALPWFKLIIDTPINTVLSVIFIAVICRQYRQFGSSAWKQLIQDGIQAMCASVFSNVVCMVIVGSAAFGTHSDLFFIFDWLIVSLLMVDHISSRKSTSSIKTHRPRTRHVLDGFSQIDSIDLQTFTINVPTSPTSPTSPRK
jgi:hypothetical protein